MKHYDVVIIGGGTAGIFAAYELNHFETNRHPSPAEEAEIDA